MEDDKQLGHPVTMKTDENAEKVMALVKTDHYLGIKIHVVTKLNRKDPKEKKTGFVKLQLAFAPTQCIGANVILVCWYLAQKQVQILEHGLHTHILPHQTQLKSSLIRIH